MQIIYEREESYMSKEHEKRLLDEALKEVDSFFSANGLLEAINAFSESEEVSSIIQKGQNSLISNMKKIEADAPVSVKHVAEELRSVFKNNVDSFRLDAIANFKIRFHISVEMMLGFATDAELRKMLIERIKESIHDAGIKDMNEICTMMLQKNTTTFMERVYSQYTPSGMPEEVASFVRLISGGGLLIPFTAFVTELDSEIDDDQKTDEIK